MAEWYRTANTGNSAYRLVLHVWEGSRYTSGNGATTLGWEVYLEKAGSSGGYGTFQNGASYSVWIANQNFTGSFNFSFGANDAIGTRRAVASGTKYVTHSSNGTVTVPLGEARIFTNTSIGESWASAWNQALTPITRNATAPNQDPAVALSYSSIRVTFDAPTDLGLGTSSVAYQIFVGNDSTFTGDELALSPSGPGSYTISGLTPNTHYYLGVRMRGRNGVWVWGNTRQAVTPTGLPSAPSSASLTSITASSMVLNWGDATATGGAAIQGYQVQRATNSSFTGASSWNVSASTRSQTHGGLPRTTTHYFRVRAYSDAGYGPWTSTVSATTLPELPGAPTLSSVSPIAPSTARVSWSAPSDNGGATITGYQIQRATNSSFSAGTATYTDSASPLDATGVPTGATVYWRVRAENSQGPGPWSNVVSAYQGASPGTPAAPTVTPSADGTQATVAWTAPADNGWPITSYELFLWNGSSEWLAWSGNALTATVGGLGPGGTLGWRVRAVNQVGPGPYSARTTATQPGPPGVPNFTDLTVVDGDTAQITFAAPATDGGSPITGYQIEYSTSSSFATVTTVPVAAPGVHTVDGLTAGTRYYWRIRAVSAAGIGEPSAVRNALQDEPPGVPRSFTVVPGESGLNATASWAPPLANGGSAVTNYTLRRYSSTGVFQQEYTTSQTSFFVSDLVAGTPYRWDVRANNVMGAGPATAQVSVLQPTPSISAGEYFDGDTPDTAEVTYAWTGTADLSESTATVVAPLGWVTGAPAGTHAAVLWRSSDTSVVGPYSAAVTFTRDSVGDGFVVGVGGGTFITVPEDADMTASIYIYAPRGQRFVLRMQFYDEAGDALSVVHGPAFTVPAGEWVRVSHVFRSPFGATRAAFMVRDFDGTGWSPFKAGETFYFDGAMVTLGASLYPYFDGSTTDTEQFLYSWEGTAHNSESRRDSLAVVSEQVDPLQDPDCPPFPAPPRPPSIDPSCITEVDRWRRYWIQVPGSMIPNAMVTVPILTLRTYQSSINQVRVRFYEDPDGAGETGVNPAQYVSEQIISYLPANSVLTLDSMQERAYATVGGGNSVAADHLVYGEGGTPPVWPLMDCGIGYMIALDVPSALPVGAVEMTVQFARRMR